MNRIILTASDNNDTWWYHAVIPFLLSLRQTDYSGAVGVIAYDLSPEKQAVLQHNGVLVFPAKQRFGDITIDRQYTAAHIAQSFDQTALYDTDIWFPYSHLTVFEQLHHPEKMYATLDNGFADFIMGCVNNHAQARVAAKIQSVLQKNGAPYQVGLLAGYAPAWANYAEYLDKLLTQNDDFSIEYGVDTTAFCLYGVDCDGVAILPMQYNCLPIGGIRTSNLAPNGMILPEGRNVFSLDGETVQGIHVTGNFRRWGRNEYEYGIHHFLHYHSAGLAYRPQSFDYQTLKTEQIAPILPKPKHNITLKLQSIGYENQWSIQQEHNDTLLTMAGRSNIQIINPHAQTIRFQVVAQAVLDAPFCHFARAQTPQNSVFMHTKPNQSHTFELARGEALDLMTLDLDAQHSRVQWRLREINLI